MNKVIPINAMPTSTTELYTLTWEEYLARKNYNKDVSKMCELCTKDQVRKYGKITIECDGIRELPESLKVGDYDLIEMLDDEELSILKQTYDPYEWADKNIDIHQENLKKRLFKKRWYQEMIVKCSAKRKTVRCGRRIGKTFGQSLDIVQRMVNRPGYRVLMVAPFQTQAKEMSDTIRKIIKALDPELGGWDGLVERSVTTPVQEIILKNGSTFKAFTAGANGAGATRGQGADLIVLDEADFLTQEAFNAILAILMDTPDTEMVVTSTPFGENILHKLSNTPEYKEFHFPTFVLPHYSEKLDKDMRDGSDVAGYVQEIQAEFGLDTSVVFQPEFIDECRRKSYSVDRDVFLNRDKYTLSLGCDWNGDKVGTRIVISAMDKSSGEISIARVDNVKKEGWTQVAAISKIVELNRSYNIDHIYVDEGFGESNVQQLKLIALDNYGKLPYDHPDLRLDEVVAVNFSATLDLIDVVSGEVRKKYYKNFMVEVVTRALESGILVLGDDICAPINEQMRNYIVKSTTQNGRKIYAAKDDEIGDHDLDAYMMSVMGLYLQYESMLDKRMISSTQILSIANSKIAGYNNTNTVEKRISDDGLKNVGSKLFYSYKNNKPSISRNHSILSGRSLGIGKHTSRISFLRPGNSGRGFIK